MITLIICAIAVAVATAIAWSRFWREADVIARGALRITSVVVGACAGSLAWFWLAFCAVSV